MEYQINLVEDGEVFQKVLGGAALGISGVLFRTKVRPFKRKNLDTIAAGIPDELIVMELVRRSRGCFSRRESGLISAFHYVRNRPF